MPRPQYTPGTKAFDEVHLALASPEDIQSWSRGEVTNTETINYRTQKMERGGLFCERIFGPVNDMQCGCSKYRGIQYNGIVCDKCGVEVTDSSVRRERMGHIELAVPVAHIWYLRKAPSRISLLLDLQASQVQNVVSFTTSIVTKLDESKKKAILGQMKKEFTEQYKSATNEKTKKKLSELFDERSVEVQSIVLHNILDDEKLYILQTRYPSFFTAETGSRPIYEVLKNINLKQKERVLEKALQNTPKNAELKIQRQLSLVRSLIRSAIRPEWMFLTRLPVLPPDMRPLIMLDGGRYASSDLNDLYRTVIIRNNRLKLMKEKYNAPEIILQNEKRLLQESVDALLDNSIRYNQISYTGGRPVKNEKKSITEHLTQKSGQFRQNLLGKRVDFSARSVIVVGSRLAFDECGVPKQIAIELFKPFIIAELIKREIVHTMRQGIRMIEDAFEHMVVWDILDDVIKDKVVLLNRQPTLHRQSILAFKPVLVDIKAIQLHPLVCVGYNADFDGDAMAMYLPISDEAQEEAKKFMISSGHFVNSGSGTINTAPDRHDIALGCFWATSVERGARGEGRVFDGFESARIAYAYNVIDLRASVFVKKEDEYLETTVGRALFNAILPEKIPYINTAVGKTHLGDISKQIFETQDNESVGTYFNAIKEFGFEYSFISGLTVSWTDYPDHLMGSGELQEHLQKAGTVQEQYESGFLSDTEKRRKKVGIWEHLVNDTKERAKTVLPAESPLKYMIESEARGSWSDLAVVSGLLGILTTAQGESIEEPVLSSYKKGLSPIEFFKASFGGRKGLVDTAMKTRNAGYFSRRLFDMLHDVVVRSRDCGTMRGLFVSKNNLSVSSDTFPKRVSGRVASEEVVGKDGKVIVKKNQRIDGEVLTAIREDSTVDGVKIRSPLSCNEFNGVCQWCYGDDITKNGPVDIGSGVGVIASTSIAEPGTQLTMRTFHFGGAGVVGGDITTGLLRVEGLADNIKPKAKSVLSPIDGTVASIESSGKERIVTLTPKEARRVSKQDQNTVHTIPENREIIVSVGDAIEKGDPLTDGQHDLEELNALAGKAKTQQYIIDEINQVYELQGIALSFVHFELLVRRMYSLYEIIDPGDSEYTVGDVMEESVLMSVQQELKEKNMTPVKSKNIIQGIKRVALQRDSFLSSASFERSTEGLIKASLSGSIDPLNGLKENVIAGRLVPVGSGFEGSEKYQTLMPVYEESRRKVRELRAEKPTPSS